MSIAPWIDDVALRTPDKIALHCAGLRCSYAALAHRIGERAAALHGAGVGRGDIVAWLGYNGSAQRSGFDQQAQLVDVLDVLPAQVRHREAAPLVAEQALGGQPRHRLAHRGARHAEQSGELFLLQRLPGLDGSAPQLLAQRVVNALRQGGVPFEGLEDVVHGRLKS